ncbi:MAG TPA: phosphatidylserine decarboxylase family protein [Gemmatimonadales bacterium]|jgi:phosphatidylserine decarboxylase|nr:phosphatidylserine decarboxylase family protein [Gemmatimonadales bacterium]
MRTAPEGRILIGFAWIIVTVLALLHWWIPLALWLPVACWVIAFFRDPVREGPRGDDLILAPADGKVVGVIAMDEPTFLRAPATRISIFMNVFDVHVNRYPAAGRVAYRLYSRGKFGHAMPEKASTDNEQCSLGLETRRGKLLIRQIAGSIARRIVTDHQPDTEVRQAERMGLIRFGSRVDLFVPLAATVLVETGQTTRAGQTVVARWS